jgi:hypothetical protein
MINYLKNQQIIGPALGVIFSVLILEYILPFFRREKIKAKERLDHFYNVAYAFVKIREKFSINIGGKYHDKDNCGWFHNFQVQGTENTLYPLAGPVGDEAIFFNYVSANFAYIDDDLKEIFIEYLKCRVPEAVQKGSGCEDQRLIDLRKEIESLIIEQFRKYQNIVGR